MFLSWTCDLMATQIKLVFSSPKLFFFIIFNLKACSFLLHVDTGYEAGCGSLQWHNICFETNITWRRNPRVVQVSLVRFSQVKILNLPVLNPLKLLSVQGQWSIESCNLLSHLPLLVGQTNLYWMRGLLYSLTALITDLFFILFSLVDTVAFFHLYAGL